MIASLAIEALTLRRGERQLFAGLSLAVSAGEAVSLVGPNGVGKTSLIRAIAGFIAPTEGRISFAGEGGPIDADEVRRNKVHLLGHQDGLKGARTAGEELLFQACWFGGTVESAQAAAEMLDLTRLLDLEVRKLSAGQRRWLALARIIAAPRDLWLLDEPMAPLDTRRRALFGELIDRRLKTGGLVIAAVHDPLPITARSVEIGR